MKLEQLIVQYLYQNKSVSIQDIGTFTLSPEVIIPGENEKDQSLPPNAIHFEYNGRQAKDEGLIDFIVAQTRKIRPLAASDLESYSLLSRQFLNIGKPLNIEGIGTLQKTQQGTYDFVQGIITHSRPAMAAPLSVAEQADDEISFSTAQKPRPSGKGLMFAVIAVLLICVAGSLYYFFVYKPSQQPVPISPARVMVAEDTSETMLDTNVLKRNDSLKKLLAPASSLRSINDSFNFAIIIKKYRTKAEADRAYLRLSNFGHRVILQPVDSTAYRIIMPFTTPLSDTLRAKDSLRIFFDAKTSVLL